MTATTEIPQIQKTQFQNNSGGWIGVVVIDPKGNDRGISVAPDGTVWLSEAEQRLTANAPRRPEDNPFIGQTHTRRSEETGELEEIQYTPLTVCAENRWVPADTRPIPATNPSSGLQHAQAAATGEEAVTVTEASAPALQREQALADAPANIKPNEPVVPARAAAAAAAADETAQDETGAAVPPQDDAPEGEYQANEEVGTPVQASTEDTEVPTENAGEEPAPWNG